MDVGQTMIVVILVATLAMLLVVAVRVYTYRMDEQYRYIHHSINGVVYKKERMEG